jgi:Uma2 family endonuclease
MARLAPLELTEKTILVPAAVRFPVELDLPPGFAPDDPGTWPAVEGRLEWVGGRLLYMPPCGSRQSLTVADVVATLAPWVRAHPGFVLGTNEAGMALGGDVRGADVAIWRRAPSAAAEPGLSREPPVLAVEVSGRYDTEELLREKARWYLAHGVAVVWVVLTAPREVLAATRGGERRLGAGETLPEHPALPGLAPRVDALFEQVAGRA